PLVTPFALAALGLKFRLQRLRRIGEVGRGPDKLHLDLVARIGEVSRGDLEFAQGRHALDRPAGTIAGEIRISEVLKPEGADGGEMVRAAKTRRPLRGRIARRTN